MLARAYGVEESKILKNENDLQSFCLTKTIRHMQSK